ncbi:MAG TPA: hypothetical protein VI749_02295 [Candidatus Omnitrophota bacterium]|nr:hypothetical protein [Candidatus Omnitrophota bacterium]
MIQLDPQERFLHFEYAKITCGQDIGGGTGLSAYLMGRSLTEILELTFERIAQDLVPNDEEKQFILYLEWDVLRCAIALYLGIENPHIDTDRCTITSIEHNEHGIEVAEVILPPKELPKILPCSLAKQREIKELE